MITASLLISLAVVAGATAGLVFSALHAARTGACDYLKRCESEYKRASKELEELLERSSNLSSQKFSSEYLVVLKRHADKLKRMQ